MLEEIASNNTAWTLRDYGILIGAITGPVAIIWNIVKVWIDSRAKIRVDIFEECHGEITEGFKDRRLDFTYRVEIFNNGPPVAIRAVYFELRKSILFGLRTKRIDQFGAMENPGVILPNRLEEGDKLIFSLTIADVVLSKALERGDPYILIYHSRSRRPIIKRSKDIHGIVKIGLKHLHSDSQ